MGHQVVGLDNPAVARIITRLFPDEAREYSQAQVALLVGVVCRIAWKIENHEMPFGYVGFRESILPMSDAASDVRPADAAYFEDEIIRVLERVPGSEHHHYELLGKLFVKLAPFVAEAAARPHSLYPFLERKKTSAQPVT